jgi:PAS domain S-box-containing protein
MTPAARLKLNGALRTATVYLLAIALPFLASWIMDHTPSLHAVPFSLFFIATVLVASFGGLRPMLLLLAVSFVLRNVWHPWPPAPDLPNFDLTRFLVLLISGFLVSAAGASRQRSQQRLQAALVDLQERTAALVETLNRSHCAFWTYEVDSGNSPRWYSGSYPIFGLPFSQVEAMPSIIPLVHPDDQPGLRSVVERMRSSADPIVYEYRTTWPNGELHWQEARATRIAGDKNIWRGVSLDITERKLAEAALLRSEKLAAMGRVASTVAHEINNPLESVTNLLYLARKDVTLSTDTQTYLSMADSELARLGHISRLTLGFARSSGLVTRVQIAPVLEEVLAIFQHRFEMKGITLRRDLDPAVAIDIAPHELRQVLTNLIANAIDALNTPSPVLHLSLQTKKNQATFVLEDNGTGINPADLPRVFEPFFSTKGETGTGIGLWVSRELVEKAGGTMTVESGDLGGGYKTRFNLKFPLAT